MIPIIRSLFLVLAVLICTTQYAMCQLKKYNIPGWTSAGSHSSATGNNDQFCIARSNEDRNLALFSMKDGCFTDVKVNQSAPILFTASVYDSQGRIHICYAQIDTINWPYANLFYTNNVSGEWSEPRHLAFSKKGIQCLNLAIDQSDHLHLGYMAGRVANFGKMFYLDNKSGYWSGQAVGDSLEAYDNCSMALDNNGYVHFAFYGFTPWNGPGYITNAPSGTWQTPEEIHPDWRGGQMEGSSISIATDSESKPHIAYSGDTKTEPSSTYYEHQQYAWKSTTTWEHIKIDNCNFQGAPCHINIDNNNKPAITYSNTVTDKMMMARDSSGTWVKKTLSTPAAHGNITYQKTTAYEYYLWDDWSGELTLLTDIQFPAVKVNKDRLDFNDLILGEDSVQYLIIRNIGNINLSICNIINSGKDQGEFIINVNKYLVVPGDSCIIQVTFKPLRPGTKSSSLFIHSNSLDLSANCIPLSGKCTPVYTQWATVFGSKWHEMNSQTISCSDGNYITVSSIQTSDDTCFYLQITKTDYTSKILWNKIFIYRKILNPLIKEVFDNSGNSTGFLICGTGSSIFWMTMPVFLRINKSGDVLWSKEYGVWGSWTTSVEQTPDGGFIIGGQVANIVNYALKLDSLGLVDWRKAYSPSGLLLGLHNCFIHSLSADSGFIILGQTGTWDPEAYEDLWIAKTDKSGNIEWLKRYGTNAAHTFFHPRGITEILDKGGEIESYIASYFRDGSKMLNLVKFDADGNTLWSKEYSCDEMLRPSSLIKDSDSTIVISAETIDSTTFKKSFLLFKVDKNGNIQWKSAYNGLSIDDYLTGLYSCHDKGFIMSGTTSSFDRRTMDIINIKTDSLGRIPGCLQYYEPEITTWGFTDPDLIDEPLVPSYGGDEVILTYDLLISEGSVDCSVNEICGYFELPDTDHDGIHDAEEGGPEGNNSGYDGNKDGIPDNNQSNVASFHNAKDDYVTISSPPGTSLHNVNALPNPEPINSPENAQFNYDFFGFIVDDLEPGGSIVIDLYLPQDANPELYYKYGMLQDSVVKSWYEFKYNDTTGAVIDGNKVSLFFTDGLKGDDDLTKNGVILDIGGPAIFLAPDISCNTDTLRFNTLEPGENETKNIIIKNQGEKTLVIDSVLVSGADSLLFEIPPAEDLQVLPGQEFSLPATFAPGSPGNKSAALIIYSNDIRKGPQVITLLGTCSETTEIPDDNSADPDPVTLYPNPAGDLLNIIINIPYSGKPAGFEVIDLTGKKLLWGSFERIMSLDTRKLNPGSYLIRIGFGGKIYRKSFILL